MLNVYNDAFAKVELGLFDVEQYLFRAFACYRGHAGYDINILKVIFSVHVFLNMNDMIKFTYNGKVCQRTEAPPPPQ